MGNQEFDGQTGEGKSDDGMRSANTEIEKLCLGYGLTVEGSPDQIAAIKAEQGI